MKKLEGVQEGMRLAQYGAPSEVFEVVKVDSKAGICTLEHPDPRRPLVTVALDSAAALYYEDAAWYEEVRKLEEGRAQGRAKLDEDVDDDGIPNWRPEHV
jgi:hypothetical protein